MSQSLADKLKLKITGKLTPKTDEPAPVKGKKKKFSKEEIAAASAIIKADVELKKSLEILLPKEGPKPADAPKQAQDKPRTCCGTKRGKDSPHDVKCHTLVGKKKLHIGFDLPGGRFPVGTKMDKTYHEGGFWSCLLGIPSCDVVFEAQDGNALQVEWKVTKKYIAWLKENAAAPVVPEVKS